MLLAHTLTAPRSYLYREPEQMLTPAAAKQFQRLLNARAAGTPCAYLIGCREFWSLSLKVSPAVLIPRPETELLVALALAQLPTDSTVIELGTGSGALACALALERPDIQLIAIELSLSALSIAADNMLQHKLKNIQLLAADWLHCIQSSCIDAIVTNPPYVASDAPELSRLATEPILALDGGADGLVQIRHIVAQSYQSLRPGGYLMLEHGSTQGTAVRSLCAQQGFELITTHRDLAQLERVTVAHRAQ